MGILHLRLLGGFRADIDGRTLAGLPTRKSRALLAMLAVAPGYRETRERLAALLWERSGEEQARASLRQTLAGVRKVLAKGGAGDVLEADSDAVWLDGECCVVDTTQFELLLLESDPDSLDAACGLYSGDFVSDLSLREGSFEAWLVNQRRRFQELATRAFGRLLGQYLAHGNMVRAADTATRLLAIDPLQDDAHRALMKIHSLEGRRGVALRQFETYRDLLKHELDVEPDAETIELAETIRTQEHRSRAAHAEPESIAGAPTAEMITRPKVARDLSDVAQPGDASCESDPVTLLFMIFSITGNGDDAIHRGRLQKAMRAAKSRLAADEGTACAETDETLLAKFPGPLKGVHCGVEVQRDLNLLNSEPGDGGQIQMRAGVTIADVGSESGGDSAATRIASIAEPGEILVSEAVFQLVKRSNQFGFKDKRLIAHKDIDDDRRLFHVVGEVFAKTRFTASQQKQTDTRSPPSGPSVAVMPFSVIGSDPEQEYFADGVTDDIITELARFGSLIVISRSATFAYKHQDIDPREVGLELGTNYVLEGSVRRSTERIRVTSQLIEASHGGHVWAERYDREVGDLFDIQDELVRKIAATLIGRVRADRTNRARRKQPADLDAYDCLLRGLEHHRYGGVSKEYADTAVQWIDKAIGKDPEFARAYAWRACASSWMWPPDDDFDTVIARSKSLATRALELDENEPEAHRIMGAMCLLSGEFEKAKFHHLRAIQLNPNDADLMARCADFYVCYGDADKAVEIIESSKSIDPFVSDPTRASEATAFYFAQRYSDAIAAYLALQKPDRVSLAVAVAVSVNLGDSVAIKTHRSNLLRLDPSFSIRSFLGAYPPFRRTQDKEKFSSDLAAGELPED